MLPRHLNLPQDGPLKTQQVEKGLYVVLDAYSRKQDYFETSRLYVPPAPEKPQCEKPGGAAG